MLAPTPRKLLPDRSEWIAVALIQAVGLLFGARVDEFVFARSSGFVRVVALHNIPRECPAGLLRWTPAALLGSRRALRRCGAIWTDHGRFRVLPTGSPLPFTMARQDIVDALRPGACYELRWFGYEPDEKRGAPMDMSKQRTANTIYSAVPRESGDCGDLPASLAPPRQLFWEETRDGLLLFFRVDFTGPSDAVMGLSSTGDGPLLHLRIAGVPGGIAGNAALLAFLGRELGLPSSSLRVVSGELARRKSVLVLGDPDELAPRLGALAL